MGEEVVLNLGRDALQVTAMVAAPMLLTALVVGLLVSVFQAVTQINEATLTFIPKMIVIGIVIIFAGPWMIDTMRNYTVNLFENIVNIVRH